MHNYLRQLKQAYHAQQVIWLLSAFMLGVLIWASMANIDEVVVGEGRLVPSSSVQKLQSLDGGILKAIHVNEGDVVQLGQLLVTLDATRAQASFAEAESERLVLEARKLRLRSELEAVENNVINTKALTLTTSDQGSLALANEISSFYADLKELARKVEKADEDIIQQTKELDEAQQKLQTLEQSLILLDEELSLTQKAVQTGALSASELRKLERERVNVAGQIDSERINLGKLESMIVEAQSQKSFIFDEFRSKIRKEVSETDARLARLAQMLTGLKNQVEQTQLTASMAGTIKSIALPSIGGVIRPGDTILEIVPLDDKLLVETRVQPKDVGRLKAGQEAIVKFSAYDFVIHGGLKGRLAYISPDAITDDKGQSYFIAHVAAPSGLWQQGLWADKPLIPGMQAQVDILSGEKTILQYWLKPLLRAKGNAMREP